MFGAVFSGRIGDLIGRRGAMLVSEIFCIIGWLTIAFARVALWLDIGRFFVGCGIGLLSFVVPVYIAEITPKNLRGGFTSFHEFMIGFSASLAFLIGSLVTWRTFALIGTIPCILQLLGLPFIPESPRWLAKIGEDKKFETALKRLRGADSDTTQETVDIKDHADYVKQISEDGIMYLFQRKYARSITVGIGLMVFQQIGGLDGISFYTSSILDTAGFPSKPAGIISIVVVKVVMVGLGVVLMDKCGRRPLLLVSSAGAGLGCFVAGFSFFFQDFHWWKAVTPTLVLIGVLVYIGSYELGMAGIPWIIMSEIFPIHMKGYAGSLVSFVSWFGSWAVSFSFTYLFEWTSSGTFFIFSAICTLSILFIIKMVPETKGRSLEEIQASMTRRNM